MSYFSISSHVLVFSALSNLWETVKVSYSYLIHAAKLLCKLQPVLLLPVIILQITAAWWTLILQEGYININKDLKCVLRPKLWWCCFVSLPKHSTENYGSSENLMDPVFILHRKILNIHWNECFYIKVFIKMRVQSSHINFLFIIFFIN